jgi:hypothetical protein
MKKGVVCFISNYTTKLHFLLHKNFFNKREREEKKKKKTKEKERKKCLFIIPKAYMSKAYRNHSLLYQKIVRVKGI